VDPGTRVVGWGVVEAFGGRLRAVAHGAIRADPRQPVALRLKSLAAGLRRVVAEHGPAEAALEDVFYGKDARAAARIGEGRGAALVVLAEAGVPVTGYPNNVVKKAVTGGGRAGKDRVRTMIRRVLDLAEVPETFDAADALALAICHHQRRGLPASAGGGVSPRIAAALRAARERKVSDTKRN
jgi:crossover junction endodeoxyribonuclease RuvC